MLLHGAAEHTSEWLVGWKFEPIVLAPLGLGILAILALVYDPEAIIATLLMTTALSPVWLPISLFIMFWVAWMHYIRYLYWFNQENVLLHVELPPEIEKSPLAMELFFTGLWNNGSETTFIQRIWKGQYRAVTTVEIVSNGGRIGYYIHLRRGWRNFIEARLYGQFPEAKITEADDYVNEIPANLEGYDMWGTEYTKSEADALPIRTYIDYELHESPDKPETKVDPLTNILELLSSVGPDERLWLQIIMKARKKDEWYGFYTGDSFIDRGKKKIHEIIGEATQRAQQLVAGDDPKAEERRAQAAARGLTLLTGGEKQQVEAIERSLSKLVFDCGIRALYIVKSGKFDLAKVGTLVRLFDPFRYPTFNTINVTRGLSNFDYPWQDFRDIRRTFIRKQVLFQYKHRAYFYVPYDQVPIMLTTEELATLWHFPGSAVVTPGLQRVAARRAEAPPNLPTLPQ